MKNFLGKKYVQIGITAFCVIAASMLFYFGIFHTASIARGLNTIYTILTPIVYAAAISYVLWPVIRFMERSVVYRICEKKNWNPTHKVRHAIRMICVIDVYKRQLLRIRTTFRNHSFRRSTEQSVQYGWMR